MKKLDLTKTQVGERFRINTQLVGFTIAVLDPACGLVEVYETEALNRLPRQYQALLVTVLNRFWRVTSLMGAAVGKNLVIQPQGQDQVGIGGIVTRIIPL